jgi:hypothetical protein
MSNYSIHPKTYKIAKELGVKIQPSSNPNKKIDIFDWNNQFIFSIGASKYKDYYIYLETEGIQKAEERRRLYKIRHNKYRNIEGSKSYYADRLLW